MNLKSILKLACYQGIDINVGNNKPKDPEYEYSETQLQSVLNEIFSVDPVSGLPKGDIQYYLSSDGNPVVKQWLENNLLKPRAVDSCSSIEEVSDDMLVEFSRKSDESISAYQERLMSLYDGARAEHQKYLDSLKID